MNTRLKELRKMLGLSQAAFSAAISYSQGYYSEIEKGKKPLLPRGINLICQIYNVNPVWLQEGRGDIFLETQTETDEETFRRLLKAKIRALPPAAQDIILEICEDIRAALKDKETDDGD